MTIGTKPLGSAPLAGSTPAGFVAAQGSGSFTVDFTVEGQGDFTNVVVQGAGAVTVTFSAEGAGAHGVAGAGAATITFSAAGVGVVERYELRGEVRLTGILVNRLVRAYRRDTGDLVGEASTIAGRFRIHTGFVAREHVIIPIDTDDAAADWAPPCANRVLSVLAQDTV